MACKVKACQTKYMFLYLSVYLVSCFMAKSREETINTQVSVSCFPRESQWKPRVPLLSLRLAIFIIVSLPSFYRWLQDPMPTAPCSADSLDEQEPLSPDSSMSTTCWYVPQCGVCTGKLCWLALQEGLMKITLTQFNKKVNKEIFWKWANIWLQSCVSVNKPS